jgi:UDP-N-acetylglucosamine:LPS N-acetylglucosamine transferase
VLILSAGVGRGHHAAAEGLREEFARLTPATNVTVRNGLGAPSSALRGFLERFTRWQLTHCPRAYSLTYALGVHSRVGRWLSSRLLYRAARGRLGRVIAAERPDVVVSTYPGITAPLGVMRQRGELDRPLCALITDLASLHFWAHPGADLHLASYPESLPEIASVSAADNAIAVAPPLGAVHRASQTVAQARDKLGLEHDTPLVLITGGGWGLGDLAGAVSAAVELDGAQVVVVCGENERGARRLERRYRSVARVRILGYSSQMAPLLAAADVLVHGTAGVTCLEAAAHRCPVISYGLGVGHIAHNTRAMVKLGLIAHAGDIPSLTRELRRLIENPSRPPAPVAGHSAARAILELSDRRARGPSFAAAEAPVAVDEFCPEGSHRPGPVGVSV